MYRPLLTAIFLAFSCATIAQQITPKLISTAGGYNKSSAVSVSWSMGETFIRSVKPAATRVHEGFQAPSTSNPKLISLVLSKGSLSPVFSSGRRAYTAAVGSEVNSLTITPTASMPSANIKVNTVNVVSGSASQPISLAYGNNSISVVVTGRDLTKKVYTVVVTRIPVEAMLTFSGKVYLQSILDASSGLMNNTLNTSGILQAKATGQPFTNMFNYQGAETVGQNFFAANRDIVDWVLIELRDRSTPATIVGARAVFVKRDGNLVEPDGLTTAIAFSGLAPASYFVVIRHRNHLGIRSAISVDFTTSSASYDFTSGAGKTHQTQAYTSTVQVGNVWAMRGGNSNSNGNVKSNGPENDQDRIQNIKLGGSLSLVMTSQYAAEDLNMDGVVKTNGPANDQNFLWNFILGGLFSRIYAEQL
ncbi:cadherin-like beta sandwich domain-containing protein [Segetibacter sp. 3557_3]|uniref:cadherin-like beta sandwich domain-containing protein n=1 Tax=Segetibacter sp. 3557_3 TaxID=2547429 RepID=UPI00105916F2|nr:cadherin-like beta sandwich domain-containing protein [Segetibacter sp. 3557_3]TDH29072.1 cadherin-like beta sandwich domain-containing protein [Segetibacter sp. 3557_3]